MSIKDSEFVVYIKKFLEGFTEEFYQKRYVIKL